jgi:flagellin-like hook-associated protein FlgL
MSHSFRALVVACTVLAVPEIAAAAADRAQFDAAMTAATAAEARAGAAHNQWTSTEDALKAAHDDAAKGAFDDGVREARLAEAMAEQSIKQAHEQATLWHAAVVR